MPNRDLTFTSELRSRFETHLGEFERRALPVADRRTAAVAVVVVPDADAQASVILTVRAAGLRRHSGQWAFPGGRRDPGETAVETALRELTEEVGLALGPEDVLGCLDDFATRSGFVITPVVVWGHAGAELVPDPQEVAEAHLVPLAEIADPGNVRLGRIPQSDRPVLSLALLGTAVYAPTAAILHQFSEVAIHGRTTRVADYEQPLFAWR